MIEEWKSIIGYEGLYIISNLGRIKSLGRKLVRDGGGKRGEWSSRIIKPKIMKLMKSKGRVIIRLCIDGFGRNYFVSRLVLLAFVGPCSEGMECCHNDGNPLNNELYNLRWDTRSGNMQDAIRHGTYGIGMRKRVKLNPSSVRKIRYMWNTGKYSRSVLGEKFGVTAAMIWCIVKNKCWREVV